MSECLEDGRGSLMVGWRYMVTVHGGYNFMNIIAHKLSLDHLVFKADGSICRVSCIRGSNVKPVTVDSFQRLGRAYWTPSHRRATASWHWNAVSKSIVIDYKQDGRALEGRWDELRPVLGVSVMDVWEGVSHVGNASYTFTMSLDEIQPPLLEETHLPQLLSDSVCVNLSFITECDEPSSVDIASKMVCRDSSWTALNKARKQQLLPVIDRVYRKELLLQCHMEHLGTLLDASSKIERGSDPDVVLTNAFDDIEQWNNRTLDSLEVRAGARGEVSLDGGLGGMRRFLKANLIEADEDVRALLGLLRTPANAAHVRQMATKLLDDAQAEAESKSSFKESITEIVLQLDDDLTASQELGTAIADTLLQAAKANPENNSLQKIRRDLTSTHLPRISFPSGYALCLFALPLFVYVVYLLWVLLSSLHHA